MHARPFGGDFELKILRMRGFSSRFLDNQLENACSGNFLVPFNRALFGLHVELCLKKFGWGWTELQGIEQEDLKCLLSSSKVLSSCYHFAY